MRRLAAIDVDTFDLSLGRSVSRRSRSHHPDADLASEMIDGATGVLKRRHRVAAVLFQETE
jgi:hypothetical protein